MTLQRKRVKILQHYNDVSSKLYFTYKYKYTLSRFYCYNFFLLFIYIYIQKFVGVLGFYSSSKPVSWGRGGFRRDLGRTQDNHLEYC